MNQPSESQSVSICFVGLPLADQATFERVISFCKDRGQNFEVTLNPSQASILVTDDTESNLKTAHQLQHNNLLLVVSNDKDCTEGDIQMQRPLLVTRVMRTMESLPTEPAAPKAPEPAEEVTPLSETDYTALVIDDSSAIRKQLEIELRTAGLSCDFAESGEQALEKVQEKEYDLIFLDIMMPGIDGYQTCGKIRRDSRYKKTPVVMLSGKTAPLDEVKGVIAGATTYLTKPVKRDQFQRVTGRIVRWLDEFRQ
ncbi:response regulator [Leucothrix sargassi]|nr:response regulator [Leucothrix sargassi]